MVHQGERALTPTTASPGVRGRLRRAALERALAEFADVLRRRALG
jgi:hypothetical protein